MKKNYLNDAYKTFLNSFKRFDKKTIFIVLSDLLFLVLLLSIFTYFPTAMYNKVAGFDDSRLQNANLLDINEASSLNSDLRGIFMTLIIYPLLMVLLTIINFTVFQGISWSIALKKKLNIKFFLRFFLLNLSIIGIYTMIIFLLAFIMKQEALPSWFMVIMLIWLHFGLVIYAFFVRKPEKISVKKAIEKAAKKVHLFILPYAVIFLMLMILNYIMILITRAIPVEGIGVSIMAILMVVYAAWARYYFVDAVDSIK